MKNRNIFIRTFVFVLCVQMIFNIFDLTDGINVEFMITIFADIIFAVGRGFVSIYFLHTIKIEVSYNDALNIMKLYSKKIMVQEDKAIAYLSDYKSFFMGNMIYDKYTNFLYGPHIMLKNIVATHKK